MAWNLSGLTIILLFLNQSITISDPDCKTSINSKIVSANADNVLPPPKLWSETSDPKIVDRLKNMVLILIPEVHLILSFDSYCTYCLCERIVFGYLGRSNTFSLKPYASSFAIKKSSAMQSKALDRSVSTAPIKKFSSRCSLHSSTRRVMTCCVL